MTTEEKPYLNLNELVQRTAARLRQESKDDAQFGPAPTLNMVRRTMEGFLAEIKGALRDGREVNLMGLGRIYMRMTPARMGRNPRTKEPIPVPAHMRLGMSFSKRLKAVLNEVLR